ncbi:MAG: amino acid ABC transporter ATP-binding protein [Actinomycetales bacterium]|nr:amino acid ABC transporter ATP-binding protein [Actinomycetales bacterium]
MTDPTPAAPPPVEPERPFVVEARAVVKRFGSLEVLKGIDLSVQRGQTMVIVGPSGSGKSTFLRCINRLETLNGGYISVEGEIMGYRRQGDRLYELTDAELARQRTRTGMVFQQFNLFGHLTALQNITEAPVRVLGLDREEARARARALLATVGLEHKADSYPAQLSGGQQQRVAIARALAMQPSVMLFDEPTSALDPELVGEVLGAMRSLAQSGMTMIVVTHEMSFARDVGNTLVVMDDGRIIEQGTPAEVLDHPTTERAREFFSRVH